MVELDTALKVVKEISSHGYEAYLVGGMVRNHLLDLPSNDIDVTTNATPMEINEIFQNTLPNEDYGSVTVFSKGVKYEITTFRREFDYVDHRRPTEIKYIDDLVEDLQRRDFTINTICMDSEGNVVDHLNGQEDLKLRIIRCVGDANTKFFEDALRMLRAIRFATVLNFDLDPSVYEAIRCNKQYLRNLSYDRKKQELDKIFSSSNSYKGIKLMLELGLDKELELDRLNMVKPTNSSIGVWAILNVVDKYPFSANEKELINLINGAMINDNMDPKSLYKYGLYANSVAGSIKEIDIKAITEEYNNLVIKGRKELAISSDEIMNLLNKEPGSYMSEIYDDIETEVLYKRLNNDKDELSKYIVDKYKD